MSTMASGAAPITPATTWPRRIALALADIKIAHTVFALPFAVLGVFLATPAFRHDAANAPPSAGAARSSDAIGVLAFQLLLILVCMFLARTWAMIVNRWADWRFDAANARTARRAIASGKLAPRQAVAIALVCAACFLFACAGFWAVWGNPLPLILGVPVLAWLGFYSFTKRFTALSHIVLGISLGLSPNAAAAAIEPGAVFSTQGFQPTIVLLAGFVLLWVAGFDVAYALQDLDFDRKTGLRSIPARVGVRGALWIARLFHVAAFILLLLAWRADTRFGVGMGGAIAGVGLLLFGEHVILARRGIAGLPLAFGTLNGVISVVLGIAGCVDIVV